jgi:hypothetical protein
MLNTLILSKKRFDKLNIKILSLCIYGMQKVRDRLLTKNQAVSKVCYGKFIEPQNVLNTISFDKLRMTFIEF